MRLIDADKIDFGKVFIGASDFAKDTREAAQKLIDEQPTAYDVDKFVEELRDLLWDCYADSGVGIDREAGFKTYEREMERIVKQNRR